MRVSLHFLLAALLFAAMAAPHRADDKGVNTPPDAKAKIDTKLKPDNASATLFADLTIGGKTLAEWIKQTKSLDPAVRQTAVSMIGQFPADKDTKKKVTPILIGMLTDRDEGVSASSLTSLQAFLKFEKDEEVDPKDMEKIVTALTNRVRNGIAFSRLQATNALAQIGPPASKAITPLLQHVIVQRSPGDLHSWELRRAAAYALGRISYEGEKGPNPQAIGALMNAAQFDECSQVRLTAVFALGMLGFPKDVNLRGSEERALLLVIKNEKDEAILIWARVILIQLEQEHKPVQDFVRKRHEGYINDLARTLKTQSKESDIRAQAAQALGWLGPLAKVEIPLLIQSLQDSKVCSAAVTALGSKMKSELTDAQRDTIAGFMKDRLQTQETRASAALAVGSTESVAHIPALIQTLNDDELPVADAAATALGSIKEKLTAEHLDAIAALLNNQKSPVETRRRSAQALGLIGAKGKIRDLVNGLKDADAGVASSCVAALAAMKDNLDPPSVQGIAELAKDSKKPIENRVHALQALGLIGSKSRDFVPIIMEAAKAKDLPVANAAIVALAKLGKDAKMALPTLVTLKEHRDPGIRENASQAIDEIRGLKVQKKTDTEKKEAGGQ
jgi:HEAT repeat protein